jgi:hypothetical protein
MRELVFIVSPNRENLGNLEPIRPLRGTNRGSSDRHHRRNIQSQHAPDHRASVNTYSNACWLTIVRHADCASMTQHGLGKQDHIASSITGIAFHINGHETLLVIRHQCTSHYVAVTSSLDLKRRDIRSASDHPTSDLPALTLNTLYSSRRRSNLLKRLFRNSITI